MGGGKKRAKLKSMLAKIFRISNWKLLLIVLLLCFWAATLLRIDHIEMTKLRSAVLAADEAEDDKAIASSLTELRRFTTKHIVFNVVEENGVRRVVFGTGPFYLEHQYMRAANAAIAAAKAQIDQGSTENPNGNIFAKVAEYCDAWGLQNGFDYPSQPYLDCWVNKLAEYPASETMGTTEAVKVPSTSLFRYDYASPLWYPCPSGILILIILILSLVIIVRFFIWLFIRIAIMFIK